MKDRQLTLGIIRDYILEFYPKTLWWDGMSKHETFNHSKSYKHRQGMPDEIRIEFDYEDTEKNWKAINFTAIELNNLGLSFAVFYTEGGRGPHIHIYGVDELETLNEDQRKQYREKFLKKVCCGFDADIGLCDEKHLCALEFANHFKYHTPKKLLHFFWNGKNMGVDYDIKYEVMFGKKKSIIQQKNQKKLKFGELLMCGPTEHIKQHCMFEKVLEKYNIKYKGHMALCPFHNDTNYSLSFSNEKGLWKCFGSGCGKQGDVISLIKYLRERNGN